MEGVCGFSAGDVPPSETAETLQEMTSMTEKISVWVSAAETKEAALSPPLD